ncbi:MAG TPA: hypothetical protein PK127_00515 [Clostridiales bacterium]|nr:hypothetical protein [Clostridiales bacterium]HPV00949.1 hypothetical protein [Clostridiales bacterium]
MRRSLRTEIIALNGVLGALAVICLLLADVLPTSKISLYALSSFFVSIAIIEGGIRAGWIFYAATAILGSIIVPDKISIVPYALFFGVYGIIKFYIEKLNRIVIEYVLKVVFFNACAAIIILAAKSLFEAGLTSRFPWVALVIAGEIIFLVYDFVYTLFINYYRDRLRAKILKR